MVSVKSGLLSPNKNHGSSRRQAHIQAHGPCFAAPYTITAPATVPTPVTIPPPSRWLPPAPRLGGGCLLAGVGFQRQCRRKWNRRMLKGAIWLSAGGGQNATAIFCGFVCFFLLAKFVPFCFFSRDFLVLYFLLGFGEKSSEKILFLDQFSPEIKCFVSQCSVKLSVKMFCRWIFGHMCENHQKYVFRHFAIFKPQIRSNQIWVF